MRIDHARAAGGRTGGTRWWSVTMTSSPRAFAVAISASLVEPQSTVTMTVVPRRPRRRPRPATGRGPRRAGSARTAPRRRPKRRSARTRMARPGQAVGVEVAEDQDPLRPDREPAADACEQEPGVRQQRRVVEAVERVREPGRQVVRRSRRRAAASSPANRAERPRSAAAAMVAGVGTDVGREGPAEAGFDHVVRMPRAAAPRLSGQASAVRQDAERRTRGAARRGEATVPAVLPELPVDEQRCAPRRSTSRCRR